MKRETCFLAMSVFATLVFVFGTVRPMCAQYLQGQPGPAILSEIPGPKLIAWSQLQKPAPVPQPLPPPDRPMQQPDTRSDHQPVSPQAPSQPPAAQTFTGTIVKDGSSFILKVLSYNVYQLDDQEKAKRYEGKQVRIEGTLDASGNTVHITSIELLS